MMRLCRVISTIFACLHPDLIDANTGNGKIRKLARNNRTFAGLGCSQRPASIDYNLFTLVYYPPCPLSLAHFTRHPLTHHCTHPAPENGIFSCGNRAEKSKRVQSRRSFPGRIADSNARVTDDCPGSTPDAGGTLLGCDAGRQGRHPESKNRYCSRRTCKIWRWVLQICFLGECAQASGFSIIISRFWMQSNVYRRLETMDKAERGL
ncbi:hypothetical protein TcasGA2_TC013854 [Tribolium castaneum]|uniref:Uncharacterized protein n=1 Tax=Tribolium castaneum TaxID=7070 RepID=D6WNQ5_TRICA|nr:hypothetical protein TcasGA2_TC013854 [Tribolium castaneum]